MSIELKIKSKHLAEEARIIKFEAEKLKRRAKLARERQKADDSRKLLRKHESIVLHNRHTVRAEARATFLTRAFIKGVPYKVVEASCKDGVPLQTLSRVLIMAQKYGERNTKMEQILDWLQGK